MLVTRDKGIITETDESRVLSNSTFNTLKLLYRLVVNIWEIL